MTGDDFAREAAAVSQRWAVSLREMGYLHAAVELDHAADRMWPLEAEVTDTRPSETLESCVNPAACSEQTHVA